MYTFQMMTPVSPIPTNQDHVSSRPQSFRKVDTMFDMLRCGTVARMS